MRWLHLLWLTMATTHNGCAPPPLLEAICLWIPVAHQYSLILSQGTARETHRTKLSQLFHFSLTKVQALSFPLRTISHSFLEMVDVDKQRSNWAASQSTAECGGYGEHLDNFSHCCSVMSCSPMQFLLGTASRWVLLMLSFLSYLETG